MGTDTSKLRAVVLPALLVMFAWGAAFPLNKLAMAEFLISDSGAASKMLFAGARFTLAGLITLVLANRKGISLRVTRENEPKWLVLYGLVNTCMQYFFFYLGIANCSGSKSSIINSLSTFELILLACVIFRERMTLKKAIGCILGLVGIIVTNLGSDLGGGFTMAGEGMMLMATLSAAFGGILARFVTRKNDVMVATGWSLFAGGLVLVLGGLLAGGRIGRVTPVGIVVLLLLVAISAVGFIIYNRLLKVNPVSEIAIYNALIPCFGTMLSCILLGEAVYLKYFVGIVLISAGIWAVNSKAKE